MRQLSEDKPHGTETLEVTAVAGAEILRREAVVAMDAGGAMSMTAEERAKDTANKIEKDFYYMDAVRMIADALRAHANAALEEAWRASASVETTGKDPQRVHDEILVAIRALQEPDATRRT